jgi:hypothetical protein
LTSLLILYAVPTLVKELLVIRIFAIALPQSLESKS